MSTTADSSATAIPVGHPEVLKSAPDMYAGVVALGAKKARLSAWHTFVLGILSGCHVAFGAFVMLAVGGNVPEIAKSNPGLQKLILGSFGLPCALLMTLTAGGELFTGNTAFLAAAVMEKKATMRNLAKNWFYSYFGNFVGGLLMAGLVYSGHVLWGNPLVLSAAIAKSTLPLGTALARSVMCNWLVSMCVYIASGVPSLGSKMVAVWFLISAFAALGMEHCVANMFMIPLGMLHGAPVSIKDFLLRNMLPVTIGNIFSGSFIVAGIYHIVYGSHNYNTSVSSTSTTTGTTTSSTTSSTSTTSTGGTGTTSNN